MKVPDYCLGIDPGLGGGLALLDTNTRQIEIFDMPVTDDKIDPAKLAMIVDICKSRGSIVAAIENVSSRPHQAHAFSFGFSTGVVHGVLGTLGVQVFFVQPVQWKSAYGLRRLVNETQAGTKSRAREIASKLWPSQADLFKRVKDADRAESALIARFFAVKNDWLV